ncbi:Rieske (2Fe-2S) protein [Sediminibacterium sp.]|uniref:Rieske (2Fe-2S) protein n=1 Tax=Sediminibacterium sp. TaxID=1917865 RepID=UPI003F7168ED
MEEASFNWIKVADYASELVWQSNQMCIVEADGKKITLALKDEQIFAFAHKCPHASGIMADGFIDLAGNVVCPLHRYRFSIQNGRNTSGEGYFLRTYPVKNSEEGVFIGFKKSFLGF